MTTDSDPHGWRIAGLIVFLALALTAGAWTIHTKTFCDPTHPECKKIAPAAAAHDASAGHATDTTHGGDHAKGAPATSPPAEAHGQKGKSGGH